MTNFNVKILGTANLTQMTAAFAKVEGEVAALNKQLDAMISKSAAVDAAGFERMTKAAEVGSKTFRNAANSTGLWSVEQHKVNSLTDDYIKKLQAQKLSFRDLWRERATASKAFREQLKMENMAITQRPGTASGGKAIVDVAKMEQVHASMSKLSKEIGWIAEQTKSGARQMLNWGKNTQWAGRQLMVGFTMPVAAFGAAAGVLAYQIDKELTRVQKVYNTTANQASSDTMEVAKASAEMNNVRAAALATATAAAKEYGASAKDTLSVQAELAATGKTGMELQRSTAEVMRIATLGEMDYQDSLQATITMQSVFKMSNDELTDSFNYMNSIENSTSLQLKDFAQAIPIAAAPIKQFGGDIKELGILLTAMKERGVGAVQGANAIKAAMQRLGRPSAQIKEEFTALTGADITKIFDDSKNLTEIFQKINDVTESLSKQDKTKVFAGLFGSYQVTRMAALVNGMGDLENGVGQVSEAYRVAGQDSSAWASTAEREMAAIQKSISGRFSIALETLKIQIASLGKPFIVVATKIISAVTGIVKAFNGLPNIAKIGIAIPIVVAAIAGPIVMLVGLFANLAAQAAGLGASILGLFSRFKSVTTEQAIQNEMANKASQGFVTEATKAELLALALDKLAASERAAAAAAVTHSQARGTLSAEQAAVLQGQLNAPMATGGVAAAGKGSSGNLDAASGATDGKEAGRRVADSAKLKSNWSAIGGSMLVSAGAMGVMAVSSNKTVDNVAEMVLYASMFGPLLTAIPFGAMATKVGKLSGGMKGGLIPAAGRFGTSVASSVFEFGKFAGPAGLVVAAIAGMAILNDRANDAAQAMEKMNDSAKEWGDILGYAAIEPGQLVDPKTGEVIDSLQTRVNKLNESVPEVGAAIHDAFFEAADGMSEAEKKAKAVDLAVRQGLQVIATGGTAENARQAVEASLMAGLKNRALVSELMTTVNLRVKFNVDKSLLKESLLQVDNQIQEFLGNENSKTKSEWTIDLITGQEGSDANANIQAAKDAADTFWDAYNAQTTTEGRNKLMQGFRENMDALQRQALDPVFSNPDVAQHFKDAYNITDSSASVDFVWKQMQDGWLTKEDIAVLEKAGIHSQDLVSDMAKVDESTGYFLDSLSKASGIDFSWGHDLDQIFGEFDPNYITQAEAFSQLQERTLGQELEHRRSLTKEEKLSLLNSIRVERGQKKTGNYLDLFGEATKKWTGETNKQKAATDKVNNSLNATDKLIRSITAEQRTELMKNAMTGFQQGIADATMKDFQTNMDGALAAVAADAENRQNALARRQEAASKALDDRWKAKTDAVSKAYDTRIENINNAIKAEQKADEIRQKLFDAEISRLDRLAEAANTNIDFNVAINTGNLDEAAKIRNDVQAKAEDFALSQSADAGSTKSQRRQDAQQKRIDAIGKEKDARLEAMSEIEDKQKAALERAQARRKDALDKELEQERTAAEERWNTRHDYLEKSLEDFTNVVALNEKDLAKHVKNWEEQHKGLSLTTEGQFEVTADNVETYIKQSVSDARDALVNQNQWAAAGEKIANDMIKGAFAMSPTEFSEWLVTGKTPKGWNIPKPKADGHSSNSSTSGDGVEWRHEGGVIGSGSGSSRKGVASNIRGLHPNETMVRAQKGEFVVNRRDASRNADALNAINSGAKISSDSPRNIGLGTGGAGRGSSGPGAGGLSTGFAGLMASMMMAAVRSSIQNGIITGGLNQLRKGADTTMPGKMGSATPGLYGDRTFSAEQLKNASTIASVGKGMGMSTRDIEIGIMTAITESGLINIHGGDRDSQGLFQQRPSMGWGTVAQVTDPTYAATKFFSTLKGVSSRGDMTPWMAAQSVQRSAFADGSNYKQYWNEALGIYKGMSSGGGNGTLSSFFAGSGGWHKASVPGKGWSNTHDYHNGPGSPLYAASDGVITDSRAITSGGSAGNGKFTAPNGMPYRSYGETIAMRTASGDILRYAHLSPQQRYVSVGQKVSGGSLIGRSGETGNAWGPHTHFDVNGDYNASGWMAQHGISLRKGAENIRWDNTIANLHKGESVLTKDISSKFREGVDNFASGGNSEYNLTMHFGNVSDKEEIAKYVINTIQKAEARKPRSRRGN